VIIQSKFKIRNLRKYYSSFHLKEQTANRQKPADLQLNIVTHANLRYFIIHNL